MESTDGFISSEFDAVAAIAAGRACIGVPYLHQGRNHRRGLDCSGLTFHMLQTGGWRAVNPKLTYSTEYSRQGSWENIQTGLASETVEIKLEDAKPMDVILIHWQGIAIPQHFAVITEVGQHGIYIIHTHSNLEAVAEHRLTEPLRRRIYSVNRFHNTNK